MDERVAAQLDAQTGDDEAFVVAAFRLVLRREPEPEALARALGKLGAGTLSRATLVHELACADEFVRVRQLDDAVALGLGARGRAEALTWLQAPPATDERMIEIPWVLSRVVPSGRVLEVGYAFAEPAYLAGLLRCEVELVGVDLVELELDDVERLVADVRRLPLPDESIDQALLVSTLEHVGADNSVYGVDDEPDPGARRDALVELRRVLRPDGSLLVTVPLGEPGDHGWFRQDDVSGWTSAFTDAGWFVEEQEAYELTPDGWRASRAFTPDGVRYGERGPAAAAVLCTALSPRRLRRLLSADGASRTLRRRTRSLRHRGSSADDAPSATPE